MKKRWAILLIFFAAAPWSNQAWSFGAAKEASRKVERIEKIAASETGPVASDLAFLIECLKDREQTAKGIIGESTSPFEEASEVLAGMGKPAVEALVEALKSESPELRRGALRALSRMYAPVPGKPLLKALEDANPGVRKEAALTIGRLAPAWADQPLTKALEDSDFSVRTGALDALNLIRHRRLAKILKSVEAKNKKEHGTAEANAAPEEPLLPIEELEKMMASRAEETQLKAVRQLARHKSEKAIELLFRAAVDLHSDAERAAEEELANIADEKMLPLLAPLLRGEGVEKDQDWQVRELAFRLLPKINSRAAVKAIAQVYFNASSPVFPVRALKWSDAPEAFYPLVWSLRFKGQDLEKEAMPALEKAWGPTSVHSLIEGMKSEAPEERWLACIAAANRQEPLALYAVISLLQSNDPVDRRIAAWGLGRYGDRNIGASREENISTLALLPFLKDPDWTVRLQALNSLARLHACSIRDLLPALDDPKQQIRLEAVKIVAYTGGAEAVPELTAQMEKFFVANNDKDNREAAVISGVFFELLNDRLRLRAYGLDGDPIMWKKWWGNGQVKPGNQRALELSGHGIEKIQNWVEALEDPNVNVRQKAAESIIMSGDVDGLLRLLQTPKSASQDRLVIALANADDGNGRIEEALIKALQTEQAYKQEIAIKALGRRKAKNAVNNLEALLSSTNKDIRFAAARALGEIAEPTSVALLAGLLEDKDRYVRRETVQALGRIGGPEAINALTRAYSGATEETRSAIVTAVSSLPSPEATELLKIALADAGGDASILAREALLPRLMEASPSEIIEGLGAADEKLRISAAFLAGAARVRDTAPVLTKALTKALGDASDQLALQILWALGEIGDPSVVDTLLATLSNGKTALQAGAAEALGKLGDPIAVPHLIKLINHKDEAVRKAAASALGNIGDLRAAEPLIKGQSIAASKNSVEKAMSKLFEKAFSANYYEVTRAMPWEELSPKLMGGQAEASVDALSEEQDINFNAPAEPLRFRTLTSVLSEVSSKNSEKRETAVRFLGRIRAPAVEEALLALVDDKEPKIVQAAADGLNGAESPAAINVMVKLAETPEYTTSRFSPYGLISSYLAGLPVPEAVPFQTELLGKGKKDLKTAAARSLALSKDPRALPYLAKGLGDPEIAKICRTAIVQIPDPRSDEKLLGDARGKNGHEQQLLALILLTARRAPGTLEEMRKLLKADDPALRNTAVWAMGMLGSTKDSKAISELLYANEEDLRFEAVRALKRIGGKSATASLLDFILIEENQEIVDAALTAIRLIGDYDAVEPLIYKLKTDQESGVKTSRWENPAATALSNILRRSGLNPPYSLKSWSEWQQWWAENQPQPQKIQAKADTKKESKKFSGKGERIVLTEFSSSGGVADSDAAVLTDGFADYVGRFGDYSVATIEKIDSGTTLDKNSAVALAKQEQAAYVLTGSIAKAQDSYVLEAQLLDGETGEATGSAALQRKGSLLGLKNEAIADLAMKLFWSTFGKSKPSSPYLKIEQNGKTFDVTDQMAIKLEHSPFRMIFRLDPTTEEKRGGITPNVRLIACSEPLDDLIRLGRYGGDDPLFSFGSGMAIEKNTLLVREKEPGMGINYLDYSEDKHSRLSLLDNGNLIDEKHAEFYYDVEPLSSTVHFLMFVDEDKDGAINWNELLRFTLEFQ